ncbi:3-carboxy-cis,cis-muconate cycloisomerase [Rhizobium sp. TH2]|uniref:3-carboxy-cis,cis-muconate cycloisomerase n=1 Tax=Rhizobium sp. TH2 TaxID=2775403 RepID=UPI002157D2A2|nr:3-carboxy-cis,cis-muconate cycloisomerase [Rhizobium sp. TH2]
MTGFLDLLLKDEALEALIGTEADITAMISVELALAKATCACSLIGEDTAKAIATAGHGFKPDLAKLNGATLKDGVVVPELVRQLQASVGAPHDVSVHFGATSQDIIDTALAVELIAVFELFDGRLQALLKSLDHLAATAGDNPLMGRTRMQAAIPIKVSDRLAVWRGLVERVHVALGEVRSHNLIVSLAGPAGTSEKFGGRIGDVRHAMAALLHLGVPDYVPHAARDRIAALGNWLSQVTGALGKIGQDIALMAQNEIAEIALSGTGGSSAMAHKQNPVRAEVLVALARYNAVQVSGLHQSLVHEQERSGAAWTLEWMILPGMLNATGTALIHAEALLGSVRRMGSAG